MSHRLFAAVVLAGFFGSCAKAETTQSSTPKGPTSMAEIEAAIDAGEYAAASLGLVAIAQRDPKDARVQYYLGLCMAHQGDLDKAEAYYRAALSLDGELSEARSNLGLVLLDRGKLEEAEELLTAYTKARPDDGSGFYNLGLALEAKGSLAAAVASYTKAADLDPKDPAPPRALGDVARKRGKLEEALKSYREALSRSPGNPELLLVLADALVAAGRTADAVASLLTLEKSDAATAETLATAAVLLSGKGRNDEARVLLKACTGRFADYPNGFFLLGTAYARDGQWTDASLAFEAFLALEPGGEKAEVARKHLAVCKGKAKSSH
ncbi:MAG: tetratricopeptide repeat protein [Myxococcota bacterium]|jgi:tetratricopeptide (TPR) repeat protein|nr:tetratricopeptide repeat protein [Myxococcota bacterium]